MEDRHKLIKQLLYRSHNRGCRETDILIGQFADTYLTTLNSVQLEEFIQILEEHDADILDWVMQKKPLPIEYQHSFVMNQIMKFEPKYA